MTNQIDLNKLRETIKANQRANNPIPADQSKKIMVTKDGKIVEGNQAAANKDRQLSEVHQGVFAFSRMRLNQEKEIVKEKFPPKTKMVEVDTIKGWLYSFEDEFGRWYTMYAYFDGEVYQVKVVEPEVEGKYQSVHDCHLFYDGRICFGNGRNAGLDSLEHVYAKSVIWANGFTVFEQTRKYPFSVNNL